MLTDIMLTEMSAHYPEFLISNFLLYTFTFFSST